MKRSGANVYVSTDRCFYYSGDTIHVKMFINMMDGRMKCTGIELSLGRSIAIDGYRADKKMENRKLYEITNIKTMRKAVEVRVGDRNEFDLEIQTPSIDELSFMPKFTDPDEEGVV